MTTTPTASSSSGASYQRAVQRSVALERRIRDAPASLRVLTGDRPTGALHLVHYFGTLANRVRLQDAGLDVLLVIADYQVITDRDHVGNLHANVTELVADYPAELRRNPTVKAEADAAGRAVSGLLLTCPVHQAADILFCGVNVVPVGRDQLPHLEVTRTIARRFNERCADGGDPLSVPDALLTAAPLLLGTDGHKMSKSRGNAVELRASEDQTARLLRRARTDADRTITYDPQHRTEVANLLLLTALCTGQDPQALAQDIGDAGAGALKAAATEAVNEHFRPLRARRAELVADPGHLREVVPAGNARALQIAETTLVQVRRVIDMTY